MNACSHGTPPQRSRAADAGKLRCEGDALTLRIGGVASDVQPIRAAVAAALPASFDGAPALDVLIVLSELVTNALLHGRDPRAVTVRLRKAGLDIEVDDGCPDVPIMLEPCAGLGGHGLHLVSSLADDWGTSARGAGKRVWCRMPVPAGSIAPRLPT